MTADELRDERLKVLAKHGFDGSKIDYGYRGHEKTVECSGCASKVSTTFGMYDGGEVCWDCRAILKAHLSHLNKRGD